MGYYYQKRPFVSRDLELIHTPTNLWKYMIFVYSQMPIFTPNAHFFDALDFLYTLAAAFKTADPFMVGCFFRYACRKYNHGFLFGMFNYPL